ncbi:VPLPA-CTERM sorting domain-containing protein [Oceanicoccus sagamiensis]|uniref:PEP-CTERM protein-sorting domain-containing protein n=1 Tax=Oceanicoccus sagamiensis TaxID=716816 RepID=A0A1X9N804_9GAMM|nr:VPLPA-CTERM sorting domain-containing protein [Oceanicoccus sagamiensis]ARN73234.1 hypothetical protein BST96_03395 [Oceanicoccus sagamiensis]
MNYLRFLAGMNAGLPLIILLCLPSASVQAAITSYTLTSTNAYIRERDDLLTGLALVIDTRTSISGQLTVDTVSGELIAAALTLSDYSETYDWNPLSLPWLSDGSATLHYTGETQHITGGVFGSVQGTVISYNGANAWSGASTEGMVRCIAFSGALGESLCDNATINRWGSFDVELAFSADYSMASINTWWIDSDSLTANTHQLHMLAVAEVPVPAAAWMMLSALLGLAAVAKKKT